MLKIIKLLIIYHKNINYTYYQENINKYDVVNSNHENYTDFNLFKLFFDNFSKYKYFDIEFINNDKITLSFKRDDIFDMYIILKLSKNNILKLMILEENDFKSYKKYGNMEFIFNKLSFEYDDIIKKYYKIILKLIEKYTNTKREYMSQVICYNLYKSGFK